MENITNLTNKDYSSYVTQAQTSNLTNQIKKSTSSEATDEEMLAACKEFEAYLVEQVYKQVQSTIKAASCSAIRSSMVCLSSSVKILM